jgi:hypothetical protein
MTIEAMKQALEALELFASPDVIGWEIAKNAYTTLKQAIEQSESQEPVGAVEINDLQGFISDDYSHILVYPKGSYPEGGVDLYTAPPKREWVGLTDDEINNLNLPESGTATVRDLVKLIEGKLKEINK